MIPYVNLFRIDNFFFFFEILMLYIYSGGRRSHYSDSLVTNSSNMVIKNINLAAVVGATITTVGPLVMAVQWSETPIYRQSPKPLFW